MQRWLSGLRRTIGNRVTADTRPEVQILFSAPKNGTDFCLFHFFVTTIIEEDLRVETRAGASGLRIIVRYRKSLNAN